MKRISPVIFTSGTQPVARSHLTSLKNPKSPVMYSGRYSEYPPAVRTTRARQNITGRTLIYLRTSIVAIKLATMICFILTWVTVPLKDIRALQSSQGAIELPVYLNAFSILLSIIVLTYGIHYTHNLDKERCISLPTIVYLLLSALSVLNMVCVMSVMYVTCTLNDALFKVKTKLMYLALSMCIVGLTLSLGYQFTLCLYVWLIRSVTESLSRPPLAATNPMHSTAV